MMETDDQAKLRLANVEIADLRYELETLRNGTAKRPWRWVKKFQLGGGNHWCLESIPEPDNGVGDGHDRTVGIVLHDHWSQRPTELMLFVQDEINRSGERQQEIDRLRAENEKLRELLSLVWDYCRVDDNAVTEADLERKAYECREVLGE